MPAVSVVMPLRDGAPWLDECLESIARQMLDDFELLVVDDHSRDNGPGRVAAFARTDRRVRLLQSTGMGLVAALNQGLRAAGSELVARMDADDRMHPRRLEEQVAMFTEDASVVLVASRVHAFPQAALTDGMREYLRWQDSCDTPLKIAAGIYVESPFAHPSVMFRRDAISELGGYRAGNFPEDYDLWLRIVRAGHRMRKAPGALLEWRQHPGSLSRTDPRYARGAFDALRVNYLRSDSRLSGRRPVVVWGAGRRTRQRARLLRDAGVTFSAFIDIDPRKVGNTVEGLPVHPPDWLMDFPTRGDGRPFVLVYVASHGAREVIADALAKMDFVEEHDYLNVG